MNTAKAEIRRLNDAFRTGMVGGQLFLTQGIAGRPDTAQIIERVRTFSEFNEENDPHQEHDFGAFRHGEDIIFWKLDYYDNSLRNGSPDPTDATVTTRVLTIMLAQEY
jgi:hypothetical protein